MADERIRTAVKITDPTTDANQAGVDASGNLTVILASNTGVDVGDVDVTSVIPGTGATNLGKAIDSVVGGTDTGVAILAERITTPAAITPAAGDYTGLYTDDNGVLWVRQNGTVVVDLGADNDVTTEFAGSTAVATMADADANPNVLPIGAYLMGFDGTNWDRVYTVADGDTVAAASKGFLMFGSDGSNYQVANMDASGTLQVDVLTGGGTDTPTTPATNVNDGSPLNLAAGASGDAATGEIGTQKLWSLVLSSSVAWKAVVKTVENAVVTSKDVIFGRAGEAFHYVPKHRDFYSITATAGLDEFRTTFTNLDTSETADFYAAYHYAAN